MVTKGESGVSDVDILTHLKDLAVFCAAYMKHVGEVWGRVVDRAKGTCSVSHTSAGNVHTPLPRALLFREKTPDQS